MIHLPGQTTGRRIGAITQNIDVYPTLMQLFDLAPLPQFEGESLVPLMRGSTEALHDLVYSESSAGREKAVRSDDLKLIDGWRPGHREIYEWRVDPGETKNLADTFSADSPELLVTSLKEFRPQVETRIRCTPMEQPYEVEIKWEEEGAHVVELVGIPESSIAEDRMSFAFSGTVPTTGLEIILHSQSFKDNQDTKWTVSHSAHKDLGTAVHLGRTPVSRTPAIPLWQLSEEFLPEAPNFIINEKPSQGTLRVKMNAPRAKRLELEVRYAAPKFSTYLEPNSIKGFVERTPPNPRFFRANSTKTRNAHVVLSVSDTKQQKHYLMRVDGRWPAPNSIRINNKGVDPRELQFMFPGMPEDGRITPYLNTRPESQPPPGTISIWHQSSGSGGEIDAEGMSAELAKQLSSIGYLGDDE